MLIIEEQNLRFEFADTWQLFQLDEHPSYRKGIEKLNGTKAVDFLGLHKNILYFIEIKDFRGYRIQNKNRLTNGELAVEFGQKIRDSIACIVGGYRRQSYTDLYRDYFQNLESDRDIKLVLWLELDPPRNEYDRKRRQPYIQLNLYKNKLRWLGTNSHVLISNGENNLLPETDVYNLPHT